MKRNYQNRGQKRQAKRKKIAEAVRNSQRLSSRLTRSKTSRADEQEFSIREKESTIQFVEVNSFNNSTNEEKFDTTKDRSNASKNNNFSTIIVNSEIKKAIIAAGPKQPKGHFPKGWLQRGRLFSTNYNHYVTVALHALCNCSIMYHLNCTIINCVSSDDGHTFLPTT